MSKLVAFIDEQITKRKSCKLQRLPSPPILSIPAVKHGFYVDRQFLERIRNNESTKNKET